MLGNVFTMKWIKFENCITLKEGSICRTDNGEFVIVGEINTSTGTNDEFTEDISYYTEDKVELVKQLLKDAENDFVSQNIA